MRIIFFLLVMASIVMACGAPVVATMPPQTPSLTASAAPSSAATAVPPSTPSALATSPAATAVPPLSPSALATSPAMPSSLDTQTPTAGSVFISRDGTPPPAAGAVIAPANAGGLVEVARWGKGPANSLRFSPDGKLLAVASPTRIYFYDSATLQETRYIDTGTPVGQLAFSSDGKFLAAIVNGKQPDRNSTTGIVTGNQVNLYDVTSGQELHNYSTPDKYGITSLALSPDGKTLAYGADDFSIHLADIASGNELHQLRGHGGAITNLAFLPDGKTLASNSIDTTAILWDVSGGKAIRTLGTPGSSTSADMAVSPDGTTLATAYDSPDLTLWDTASGKAVHTMHGDKPSTTFLSVAFSPDGRTLAAGAGYVTTWLINAQSGNKISEIKDFARAMTFSPDGQTLALGDSYSTVSLVDAHTGRLLRSSEEHTGPMVSLALSADGKTLTASYFGEPRFKAFSVATGASRNLDDKGSCRTDIPPALSPDGRTLALVCYNGQFYIGRMDVPSGKMTGNITQKPFETGVEPGAIGFSLDGRTLAVGSSLDYTGAPQVRLYNAAGDMRPSKEAFTVSVTALAFSAEGAMLALGPNEMRQCDSCDAIPQPVGIWDVAKAAQVLSIPGFTSAVTSLAFSPDGKVLVTGSDDQAIRVWDLSGKKVNEVDSVGLSMHLAFSPDGSLLAAGTSDGTLSLWDTSTWKQVTTRPASSSAVVGLAFTPDGKYLVTGTADGVIRFWAAQP